MTAYPQYYGYPGYPYPAPAPAFFVPHPQPAPALGRSDHQDLVGDEKTARYLINFEAFQRSTAAFQTMTDPYGDLSTPDWTVTGQASFYQNPFTGSNSKYKISLTGLTSGDDYYVALADDCGSSGVAPANEDVSKYIKSYDKS